MSRHRTILPSTSRGNGARIWRQGFRVGSLGCVSVLLAGAGCQLPDAASPEFLAKSTRASIALDAQFVAIRANAINVRVTYRRTGIVPGVMIDSTVSIPRTATGEPNWQGIRSFPVEIDLAPCLLDPAHVAAGRGCFIGVTVRMLENGTQVDRTDIPEFPVEPGVVTVVPTTIVLREVGAVTIDPPVQLLRVGDALALSLHVADVAGNAITGRPVSWRSGDETIARIGADGVVTGVGPGQVTLTALVGTREGSVALTISPR